MRAIFGLFTGFLGNIEVSICLTLKVKMGRVGKYVERDLNVPVVAGNKYLIQVADIYGTYTATTGGFIYDWSKIALALNPTQAAIVMTEGDSSGWVRPKFAQATANGTSNEETDNSNRSPVMYRSLPGNDSYNVYDAGRCGQYVGDTPR